jgi:hypothetical protein
MERRGVPAALVCTAPFIATARSMCAIHGVPNYPFAVVEHPIGRLTAEELEERVAAVLPAVVELLTAGN